MKKILLLLIMLLLAFCSAPILAQTEKTNKPPASKEKKKNDEKQIQHGRYFVDKNGDGYNDNAPDDDGDGIPNALDPDFKGPRRQKGKKGFGPAAGKGKGVGVNNRLKTGDVLNVPVKNGKK